MIGQFFYTLIISPLVQIIEVCYLVTFCIFHNSGLALCAVSLAVSALTLPLYFMAEKWQRLERDTQKALAPKITKIKSVFKGDEQYLILSTLYRQNHYHPLYALRSSIGLLIQVPFFIAAYSYLSHLDALNGASFAFIRNLGAPDAAFTVPLGNGVFPVNLLPIAMTAVNIAAGVIYTKGFSLKEKVQLFAMAALFLVLLYGSPAGLVLYWTLNNVFSLVKNCLQKTKHDQGNWFSTANRQNTAAGGSGLTPKIINDYAILDLLPALTALTVDSPGTYTAFYAHLTHDPIFFQAPDYTPQDRVTNRGSGPFADVNRFHTHVATFALLAHYFRFLQDKGVYDNTRIIIVADHGRGSDPFSENIPLPKNGRLQSFNPLFMVKDFQSEETRDQGVPPLSLALPFSRDDTFMTNADVPRIALAGIAENPRNPFTQAPLDTAPPSADADIVTIGALSSYRHSAFTYSIPADEWLRVHDDIFDPANWNEVKP